MAPSPQSTLPEQVIPRARALTPTASTKEAQSLDTTPIRAPCFTAMCELPAVLSQHSMLPAPELLLARGPLRQILTTEAQSQATTLIRAAPITALCVLRAVQSQPSMLPAQAPVVIREPLREASIASIRQAQSSESILTQLMCIT